MKNLVTAIVHSNLSIEEKIGALALIGHKKRSDKECNRIAREHVVRVLLNKAGTSMSAQEIKADADPRYFTTINGALRVLTRCGVLRATKVQQGTLTVEVNQWEWLNRSQYEGHWVSVEKEVPNLYNAYTLNI